MQNRQWFIFYILRYNQLKYFNQYNLYFSIKNLLILSATLLLKLITILYNYFFGCHPHSYTSLISFSLPCSINAPNWRIFLQFHLRRNTLIAGIIAGGPRVAKKQEEDNISRYLASLTLSLGSKKVLGYLGCNFGVGWMLFIDLNVGRIHENLIEFTVKVNFCINFLSINIKIEILHVSQVGSQVKWNYEHMKRHIFM